MLSSGKGMTRMLAGGVILVLSVATIIAGCSKKEEKKPSAPAAPQAHKSTESTPLEVVQGVEKGKWKAVKIGITDKEKQRDLISIIDIGSTVEIPDSGLSIKVHYFLPDFQMSGKKVMSKSNKPNNPATFLTITDIGRKDPKTEEALTMKGYLFSRFPNTAFSHPRYNFVLMDFVPAQ
jgi:hypothetical protein